LDEADRLCDRIGVFKSHLLVLDTPTNLRASVFGRKVVFHLRQADENYTAIVREFAFAREVKIVENKLVVTLDNPDAQNPEVVRALVSAGADIIYVGELRHSLEDVYLQLVKGA